MILVCHWFRERVHYFCSIFLLIFLLMKLVIHYVWNPGRPATLLKKRLWSRCFPVSFVKFLRTPFLTEHLWWLLLKIPIDDFQWFIEILLSTSIAFLYFGRAFFLPPLSSRTFNLYETADERKGGCHITTALCF